MSAVEHETNVERKAPTTVEAALRLAIKLAVDEGDYGRAAALLEVARGSQRASGSGVAGSKTNAEDFSTPDKSLGPEAECTQ